MSRSGMDRLRKAGPWVTVLVLSLTGVAYLLILHFGTVLTVSAVVELERDLLQVNGLLIAFTGIIFTGMLAEIRHRTERALQAEDHERLDKLEKTSKALRRSAFLSFIFFTASLGDALGNLAYSLASPSSYVSMADAFVLPVMLILGGLVLLLFALALTAFE